MLSVAAIVDELDALVPRLERRLEARLKGYAGDAERDIRGCLGAVDELWRACTDLTDDRQREMFERHLKAIELEIEGLRSTLGPVATYDLFDPIRVLRADIPEDERSQASHHPDPGPRARLARWSAWSRSGVRWLVKTAGFDTGPSVIG